MEKWIRKYISDDEKKKQEEEYKKLSKEEKKELKKQKIKKIISNTNENIIESPSSKDFLSEIITFKKWLDNRNYIAGDLDKIEVRIRNIYNKLNSEISNQSSDKNKNSDLNKKYKEIPHSFLEENIRIALNKKLKGVKGNSSDTYYLRKLKSTITEKLKEAEYYNILREILES